MKTISSRLFLILILLLAAITGGVGILYSVTTRNMYLNQQCRTVEKAYEEILGQDIELLCQSANQRKEKAEEDELEEQGGSFLESYESDNLRFRIRDENFQLLYATSKHAQARDETGDMGMTQKWIQKYQEKPEAVYEDIGETGRVILRGKCTQEDRIYYIMITESTSLIDRSTSSVKQALALVLILFLIFGGLNVRYLSQSIGKPLANVVRVAGKIANKDFSERLEGKTRYQELDELGDSINEMSAQIQNYIQDLENYNRILEQENERRMELEKHRKQFVNNVSHELKTPLAIISSQAELIAMIQDDEKRQQYCSSVIEETNKMSQMIQSMLQIFAVEQGLEDVPILQVDFGRIAEEATAKFAAAFEKKKFQVQKEIQPNCMADGNPENIHRAMSNFLMNAWRYAPEQGKIKIQAKEEAGYAVFTVYNEGAPIDEKEKVRIWDSFYQGNASEGNRSQEGTGLGLYIVKSIVSQHGGLCSVENKKGGVEFGFRIPSAGGILETKVVEK